MVTIIKNDTETIIEIKGLHKLWSFKSEIRIANEHIIRVYQDLNEIKDFSGLRAFGTYVPNLIKAGTFYQYPDSSLIFLDIVNENNAIIIELKDEEYKKIIVEIEDPRKTIKILNESNSPNQ